MRGKEQDTRRPFGRVLSGQVPAVLWAAAGGLTIVYWRLSAALVQPFWCGMTGEHALGAVLAWCIYAITVFALMQAALLPAMMVFRGRAWRLSLTPVAASLALVALRALIGAYTQPDFPASPWLGVAGFAAAAAFFALLGVLRLIPAWLSALLLFGAVLAGMFALEVFGRFFVLAQDHVAFARTAGRAWMVLVLLAGTVMLFGGRAPARRQAFRLAALTAVACVTPWAVVELPAVLRPPRDAVHPNIVLITPDAMRADYLSAYGGHVETPTFDSLAGRGVRFDRAYATSPHTGPSLFSLMYASYPPPAEPDEPMPEYFLRLSNLLADPSLPTFAEYLAEAGYVTAVLNGNDVLTDWSRRGEFLRGLDVSVELPLPPAEHSPWLEHFAFLRSILEPFFPEVSRAWPLDSTRRLTVYARSFIRLNHRRPFFLWVHFMDPHTPYSPPRAFRTGEETLDFWPPTADESIDWDPDPYADEFLQKDREARAEQARLLYEGEIRYVDHATGRILAMLERLGLDGKTYVCISSDHGEEFLDHGSMLHGQTFYDEVIRVPLIFAGPSVEHRQVDSVVSLIDVMPTLFRLARVPPAPEWEGEDLSPVLRDPSHALEEGRARYAWVNSLALGDHPAPAARMIVENGYKLIEEIESGNVMLFDLDEDPRETVDLSGELPDLADRLARRLREAAERAAERWAAFAAAAPDTDASAIEERLEALGYL